MRYLLFTVAAAALLAGAPAVAAPANVAALQGTITYKNSVATGPQYYSPFARVTSKVVYDSATGTYTLRDTGNPALTSTFGPANITGSDAAFTYYSKTSGTNVETFRRLNQSGANPLIILTYVDYGQWRRSTTTSGVTSTNDTYAVFGTKTPGSAVPHSGSASYATYLDGTFVDKNGVYAVAGTGSLNAYFSSGTIDYSATLTGTREGGGTNIAFGALTGTGLIAYSSAGFKGTGTTNGSGYKLDVNGNFYGPAYQEVGGIFHLTGNNGNGTGALVGVRP
ncbi:MAG: hypothetical protein ABIS23_02495 [Sphingomicrobium sp.]